MMKTETKHSAFYYFTLAVVAIVAILAVCNWYFQPDAAWKWIRTILGLPVLWGCMTLFKERVLQVRGPRLGDEAVKRYSEVGARFFLLVISTVGLVQTISLSLNLATVLGMDAGPELPGRIKMFCAGAVFILLGNALPKILTPQSLLPEGGALRIASARRFLGWTWVLIGLAMAFISFLMPFDSLRWTGPRLGIGGILAILAAIVWINLGPRKRQA
ncbi:MAG: hypothetical protein P8Z37_06845 [Acidobacteriota bacterium]|jgi:hypothetical protein